MKKLVLAIVAVLLIAAPPARAASTPQTFVYQVRVTPGASPAKVLAFQNTSAGIDVLIHSIDIVNASTQTLTGGQEAFWVYASTQVTHSAAAGSTFSYGTALGSAPSYVSASTAPTSVLFEGDSAVLTGGAISGVTPIIAPLVVDGDDAATVNRSALWRSEDQDALNPAGPLVLNHGANRALVFEKRQAAGSDFTAGAYDFRIVYSIR